MKTKFKKILLIVLILIGIICIKTNKHVKQKDKNCLSDTIFDQYGICVIKETDPNELSGINSGFIYGISEYDDWKIDYELRIIAEHLHKYNEETIKLFPKYILLTTSIVDTSDINRNIKGVYINSDPDCIVLDVSQAASWNGKDFDHELFHAIDAKSELPEEYLSRFNSDDCEKISSYACTAKCENMAEIWANSFFENMKTIESIQTSIKYLYPVYLKPEFQKPDTTNASVRKAYHSDMSIIK